MDTPQIDSTPLSVNALLAQSMDYAGLFPPARLEMPPMVRNYASYVACPDAWMLSRVIVPVARLDEFLLHAGDLMPSDDDEPWHVSALTAPAGTPELEAHLETIAAFNADHAESDRQRAVIDVIELRCDDGDAIESALDDMPDEIYPFFELPADRDPRGLVTVLVGSDAGAKIRTGGVTPDLYPTAERLAAFIEACATAGVPMKATAGLHHPLAHPDETTGVLTFGFLGVIVAACLAHQLDLRAAEIRRVLEETDPAAFLFDEDGASWRDHDLDVDAIATARDRFFVSFGTCSFDEPRDDLRALELLSRTEAS